MTPDVHYVAGALRLRRATRERSPPRRARAVRAHKRSLFGTQSMSCRCAVEGCRQARPVPISTRPIRAIEGPDRGAREGELIPPTQRGGGRSGALDSRSGVASFTRLRACGGARRTPRRWVSGVTNDEPVRPSPRTGPGFAFDVAVSVSTRARREQLISRPVGNGV